jgi:hypothetical protein
MPGKVVIASAREGVGFIWSIAGMVALVRIRPSIL